MKLISIKAHDGSIHVADSIDDTTAEVLAELREFWSDAAVHLHASAVSTARRHVEIADCEVVPPVRPEARRICIGLNYRAHHAEGCFQHPTFPEYPSLFARWTRSLSVSGEEIQVPSGERGLDWEGEIVAYVGTQLT